MSCTYIYDKKIYSRDGLLSKLVKDHNRLTPKSISFLKDKLGLSDSEIIIVNGLIDGKSLGRFRSDGSVLLSTFADSSVAYHEAFHRVFRMYLNNDERAQLIKEFKRRSNWQSKLESIKRLYPDLSENEQIEEYFADEFSDYVLNNGDIKTDQMLRSVFDRIIDFIKKLLGLKSKTIYELYADINKGEFKKNPLPVQYRYNKSADKILINGTEYSAEVKNEFVQAIAREFLNEVFSSGTIYDLLNNQLNIDEKALYEEIFAMYVSIIQDDNPELASDLVEDFSKGSDSYILNQFSMYLKTIGGAFEITHVEQSEKDSLEESADAGDEKGRQNDDSNPQWVASFQIDPKTSMSKSIKLLLATFEDSSDISSLGLPSQVRWTKAFNKLAVHLAGVPTSRAIEHLLTLNEEWVPQLVEALGGVSPNVETLDHNVFRLRNEFIKTFAKTQNTYAILGVEDKNIKWFDANQNTAEKKKIAEWNSNMVRAINDQGSFEDWIARVQNELVDAKNPTDNHFEELLGIIVDEELKDEYIDAGNTYMTYMKKVAKIIVDITKSKKFSNENPPDYNKLFNENNFNIKGTIEKIANAQNEYDNVVDLMINSRGKRLYGIALNTHTTNTINTLNYISSLIDPESSLEEKLKIVEEYLPNILNYQTVEKTSTGYKIKSRWLNEILKGNQIQVVIVDGVKNQMGDEDAVADLDETDLYTAVLNTSVSGINISIKHSDRSVYYGYKLSGNPIFDYQQIGAANSKDILDYLTTVLQDQLATEVKRANLQDVPMIQYFSKVYKNSMLFDLKNIEKLDPFSNEISKMIRQKVEDEFKNYLELLDKWNVLQLGVSPEFLSRYNNDVNFYVANSFANQMLTHLEEMKLLIGDFAFFSNADDFYKRMSTTSGTGNRLVNDETTNAYIAMKNDFEFELTNPMTGETETVRYDRPVDGNFKVLTVYEKKDYKSPLAAELKYKSKIDGRDVSEAVYLFEVNMLIDDAIPPARIKELAEAYASNYNAVNENDGQTWINMFFFREYMMRLGEWSIEMENLFVAELKILNAKSYSDIKDIEIEIDGEKIKVFESSNWTTNPIFESAHTLKPQFAGFTKSYIEYRNEINGQIKDMSERIRPYTIYKTSFHVLWPSTVFDTNLSAVHHFMLKNKIDVLAMNSANKTGAIDVQNVFKQNESLLNADQRKVAEHGFNFYDMNGMFNSIVFNGDVGQMLLDQSIVVANVDSLKDQVRIGNTEKSEIRGSTQSLKILLSNMIVNGKPRFEGAQELVDEYKSIVKDLVIKNVDALKTEFEYSDGVVKNINNLVDTVKKSAEDKNSPINIIEAIEGFLQDPIMETLPNKTKIENIFYAIITNNAIVFNRPGNSYPQVAATGFEPIASRDIKDVSSMEIYTQQDLKFYSIETDDDGNIINVNPAEVMIPIPRDWIRPILKRYKTTNIIDAIDKLNDDISRGVVDTDITFKGVRIPNQQLSSNDIVKVKKFLPPTNSNFVVVPSELVTKVGADSSLKFA